MFILWNVYFQQENVFMIISKILNLKNGVSFVNYGIAL